MDKDLIVIAHRNESIAKLTRDMMEKIDFGYKNVEIRVARNKDDLFRQLSFGRAILVLCSTWIPGYDVGEKFGFIKDIANHPHRGDFIFFVYAEENDNYAKFTERCFELGSDGYVQSINRGEVIIGQIRGTLKKLQDKYLRKITITHNLLNE